MPSLTTVGRWLYAVPCVAFGVLHLTNPSRMAEMVPVPGGEAWVYLTGAALIAATVAILARRWAVLALRLLGSMILLFALTIHLPGLLGAADAAAAQASLSNVLKDTMLGGAALFMSGHTGPAEDHVRTAEGG